MAWANMFLLAPSWTGASRATGAERGKPEVGMVPGADRGRARVERALGRRLLGGSRRGIVNFIKFYENNTACGT